MTAPDAYAPADLAADTAVKPLLSTPGLYTADLPDSWDFAGPSGGVLMTTALRAMQAQLDDSGLRPLSVTGVFCAPIAAGPLEIRVEVLRSGGSAAQVRASLASIARPGPGLEILATFVRGRSGPDMQGVEFPDVPMPDQAEDISGELSRPVAAFRSMRFFRNLEVRLALGHRWWTPDRQPGPARCARWLRYRKPQRDRYGRLDPFAILPLADTMPPAVWQALGPEQPLMHAPSLDLTVHFVEDTTSEWLLTDARARRARRGYATADIEIWSQDRTLVAYGTQTMMFRPVTRRAGGAESS